MAKDSRFFGEVIRKAVHLSSLLIVVFYTFLITIFTDQVSILILTAILLILLEIEYMRLERNFSIFKRISFLFRKHEQDFIAGDIFIVISCIISFAAFDYWIAVVALFMTVFGDIFSALFGTLWGKTKIIKEKSIAGTGAGLIANLTIGMLILPDYLFLTVPMALTASFVELITNKLDDNLTVPLFTGFTGQMIFYFAIYYLNFNINLPLIGWF